MCCWAGTEGSHRFEGPLHPSTVANAADDVIAWTLSVIDDVRKWVPEGSKGLVWNRSRNPRGWVQGAFLVGMKDWGAAADNEEHWKYLKVCRNHAMLECSAWYPQKFEFEIRKSNTF